MNAPLPAETDLAGALARAKRFRSFQDTANAPLTQAARDILALADEIERLKLENAGYRELLRHE